MNESIELLAARIAAIPEALEETRAIALPPRPADLERVVVTGIGGSEGPARLLVACLEGVPGLHARFVPLSAFYLGLEPYAELLILFSQALSPNAELALESPRARQRWVVTSLDYGVVDSPQRAALEARGVRLITAPPGAERGLLARVVGPQVASLVSLRLAALLGARALAKLPLEEAARAWEPSRGLERPLCAPVAIVTDPRSAAWALGLRWKLLESLLLPDPPVWDVLQLAHGPLQSFYEHAQTLITLETPDTEELFARALSLLVPDRHTTVRLQATRPDALAFFEHAAGVDALLLATLRARPRDLFDWPARGADASLYGLDHRAPEPR